MIKGLIVGEAEVMAKLEAMGPRFKEEMAAGIGRLALKLNSNVINDKLQGQVLNYRRGDLIRSIHNVVVEEGTKTVGIVSTNLSYGIGWETGWAGYSPRESLKNAKAKFSPGSGSADTFKNGTPRQRSFLRSALKDMAESGVITEEINASIERAKQ